ncbi:hypothetical protein TWF694_003743 [Orbilia ellipsospora]|uniref:Uncharacterized protein n=1 Tax=Orbilia ellipsospora TaxID=2528407 RepID=A0AAV9X0C5_9PEZI
MDLMADWAGLISQYPAEFEENRSDTLDSNAYATSSRNSLSHFNTSTEAVEKLSSMINVEQGRASPSRFVMQPEEDEKVCWEVHYEDVEVIALKLGAEIRRVLLNTKSYIRETTKLSLKAREQIHDITKTSKEKTRIKNSAVTKFTEARLLEDLIRMAVSHLGALFWVVQNRASNGLGLVFAMDNKFLPHPDWEINSFGETINRVVEDYSSLQATVKGFDAIYETANQVFDLCGRLKC